MPSSVDGLSDYATKIWGGLAKYYHGARWVSNLSKGQPKKKTNKQKVWLASSHGRERKAKKEKHPKAASPEEVWEMYILFVTRPDMP
jgi:hypothetical protein